MRKQTLLKSWLLLFAIIAGVGNVWAEDTPITFNLSGTNGVAVESVSSGDVTITFAKGTGSNAPAWYDNGSALRFYSGNTITFASSGAKITKVVLTNTQAQLVGGDNGENFPSGGTYSVSNKVETWTASTALQSFSVNITNKPRLTKIEVYLEEGTPKTPIATIGDISLSEIEIGEGTIPLAGLLAYITFAEGKTVTDCVPTITSDDTSVLEISISGTNLAYNAKKAGQATLTLTLTPTDTENYSAVSKQLTVTVVDPNAGDESWVLTDLADLTEDDVFVIVGDNGDTYAMSNDKGTTGAPTAVSVTVENDKITSTVADNIKWNISGDATNGYTFYPDGETETWLYCTNTNNGVRVGTNENNTFTVNEDYLFNTATSRYIGIYSDNSVAKDWRCYTTINSNITGQTFAFYKKVTGDVTVPSITASNVEIAYDATEGAISYTINNPAEGGVLTAEVTEGSWLTLGTVGETVPFTATANDGAERTATVTLTYTYNSTETVTNNSTETVTKTVTVTQKAAPAVISTIPALFAAATSTATDVNVTFDNWVVSGVSTNGKNVFVTDGTNGFVIFSSSDQSNTYAVGNILSGTAVSCKLQLYNGFAEITNLDASDLTITTGGTVNVADIAMADLAGVNTGALVSYENLTCSVEGTKYYLSDGTTTLQVFNSLFAFDALEAGKTYNITGIYQQYNNTKEILPRSADDIVEVTNNEPSIAVSTTTIEAPADGAEGTIDVTYTNFTEVVADVYFCDADGEAVAEGTYSWVTAEINSDNNVEYRIDANEGEARTAYMMVYAFDDDVNGVYSDLITITQAAYVAPADGYYVKVTSTDDITDGQYLIVYEGNDNHDAVAFNGGLETLDAVGNVIAVTIEEDEIAATNVTRAAEFTIDVAAGTLKSASGYYIGNLSNSNGLSQDTRYDMFAHVFSIDDDGNAVIASHTIDGFIYLRYNYASNQNRFRYYKSGQQDIQLYKFVSTAEPVSVTITEYMYASFSSDKDLDFTPVTGLKAYIVTGANGSTILTEQVYKVKAGTGLVLFSQTADTYEIPVAEEGEDYSNSNKLIAVTEDNTTIGVPTVGTNYVLAVQGGKAVFAYIADVPATLNKGKAYLNLNIVEGETPAPFLGFDGTGTTGINSVERGALSVEECYTLDGRRVAQPTKGLYIVNGKKVMVK